MFALSHDPVPLTHSALGAPPAACRFSRGDALMRLFRGPHSENIPRYYHISTLITEEAENRLLAELGSMAAPVC